MLSNKNKKIKVGILTTKPQSEKKKDELIVCFNNKNKKRPWLNNITIPSKFKVKNGKKQTCIGGDVSVGYYMQYKNPKIEIDFIPPEEITQERLKKNVINFMVIYDLLESFHTDKDRINRKQFKRHANILSKAKNIYPNFSFQRLVNDKSRYIHHLAKKKVNVIPTFRVSCEDIKKNGVRGTIKNIIKQVEKRKDWDGKFITKPIFGQESIDFNAYTKGLDEKNKVKTEKELHRYFNKITNGSKIKYPGIIVQKYIEGFDKKKPEIRMYFFDEDYKYSVITHDGKVSIPTAEKGKLKVKPLTELQKFAKRTLKATPKVKVNGKTLPKALMRIDIACNDKFEKPWIINEIEFVPSLYVEDVKKIPEIYLGDAFLKIVNKITKSKNILR